MICLFKTWHSHIHVKMSQQTGTRYLILYYPVLWTVSSSSELTTKRTAELAKKKKWKKTKSQKKNRTSFSIWKIPMWSPNIGRRNPWDDAGLPALSSRTHIEGPVWSPISAGFPRSRRKYAACGFSFTRYFHSFIIFIFFSLSLCNLFWNQFFFFFLILKNLAVQPKP